MNKMLLLLLAFFLFTASFALASADVGAERKTQTHCPLSKVHE
jgi:hypothetical protein